MSPGERPLQRLAQRGVVAAISMFLAAAAAPLLDDSRFWPLTLLVGLAGAITLWQALGDGEIAVPPTILLGGALPTMLIDQLGIASLTGSALAIMLGEQLALVRADRYATPGHRSPRRRWPVVVTPAAAAAAMVVVLAASVLPEARAFSGMAVVAAVLVAVALERRRRAIPDLPLPPPPPSPGRW